MTDYGHDLLFGTFVTPAAQPPMHAVDLAMVADRAGLDLVTFQDHPYQPSFHDTWTLLSYVASRTERIHVSPNVLNLPLRQPAVIARSAASLDLLSGGRFELGIGAGGFWDAIEAMGSRRLAPGQSIEALEEAIEIMRGIWATQERGGVPRWLLLRDLYPRRYGPSRGSLPPPPASRAPLARAPSSSPRRAPRALRLQALRGGGRRSACSSGPRPRRSDARSEARRPPPCDGRCSAVSVGGARACSRPSQVHLSK